MYELSCTVYLLSCTVYHVLMCIVYHVLHMRYVYQCRALYILHCVLGTMYHVLSNMYLVCHLLFEERIIFFSFDQLTPNMLICRVHQCLHNKIYNIRKPVCSDEGLLLEMSAIHQTSRQKTNSYQPLLIKAHL